MARDVLERDTDECEQGEEEQQGRGELARQSQVRQPLKAQSRSHGKHFSTPSPAHRLCQDRPRATKGDVEGGAEVVVSDRV
jgi:hypothetical protein